MGRLEPRHFFAGITVLTRGSVALEAESAFHF